MRSLIAGAQESVARALSEIADREHDIDSPTQETVAERKRYWKIQKISKHLSAAADYVPEDDDSWNGWQQVMPATVSSASAPSSSASTLLPMAAPSAPGSSSYSSSLSFLGNPFQPGALGTSSSRPPKIKNLPGLHDPEDQLLRRFGEQVGAATPQSGLSQWLHASKGYWSVLRERRKLQRLGPPPGVSAPPPAPANRTSIPRYCAECVVTTPNVGVAREDIDLSSDRMYVSGFAAIAKVRVWARASVSRCPVVPRYANLPPSHSSTPCLSRCCRWCTRAT